MMRRLVKSGVAGGMRWTGASLVRRRLGRRSREPWIVGYHRVVEDFERSARSAIPATLISRTMLARHLDWIGRRFDVVPLDDVAARRETGGSARRPIAAVTFDDGYSDVYDLAFPLLRSKGIPAAVFVLTALVGTTQVPLYDRLHLALSRAWGVWRSPAEELARVAADRGVRVAGLDASVPPPADALRALRLLLESLPQADLESLAAALETLVGVDEDALRERRPLDWDMLLEMQRAGMTIGSHSRTHPLLTLESVSTIRRETSGSKRELEARLGAVVRHFAYPNGWFDAATIQAVDDAGYLCAYTSCRHRDDARPLHTLPRTLLWERSGLGLFGGFSPSVMGCQADGTFDRAARCPLNHWN